MSQLEPTEAQIKEFWEWCGLPTPYYRGRINRTLLAEWIDIEQVKYPPIDLNNLFKYAVPKLGMPILLSYYNGEAEVSVSSYFPDEDDLMSDPLRVVDADPALALFWAIWEVMKCN